ncbi:UNVERIFIED_CONTAM: hypothetical protein K2H54_029454 [Gekko kuhli]
MEEPGTKPSAPRQLALEQVYRLAGALGSELQRLSDLCGPGAVAGLVTQVVCLLELLEALAAGAGPRKQPLPPQQEAPAGEEDGEQALSEGRKREHLLQVRLAQVEEENQKLLAQLAGGQSQADRTTRQEREVMLRLKEVVDKQRDEIRAQAHEILSKSRDVEALQEQLSRFMAVNEELRHKLAIVQAQLKKALEEKEGLENALSETSREGNSRNRVRGGREPSRLGTDQGAAAAPPASEEAPCRHQGGRCFSKEELQQILQERNELKTSLFLVREELAYYQRELLNNERIPSLLLAAMKSAIRKQQKKVRAKMLGTPEESGSSEEEEEEGVWLAAPDSDAVDGPVAPSRIKSFFGLWYRSSTTSTKEGSAEASPAAWEIVDPQEAGPEQVEKAEEERKVA